LEIKRTKEKREEIEKKTLDSILKITKKKKNNFIDKDEFISPEPLPNSAFSTPNKIRRISENRTPTFVEKAKILLTPVASKRKRDDTPRFQENKKFKLEKIEGDRTPISYSKTAKKILEKIDEISTPYKDIQKIYSEKKKTRKKYTEVVYQVKGVM